MKLLDLDVLTDTDLEEMLDRTVPCGLPALMTVEATWCEEVATYSTVLTCRRCHRARRIFTCTPCTKWLRFAARICQPLFAVIGHSYGSGHSKCWPAVLRVTCKPLT